MKLTLQFDDAILDTLEAAAKAAGKTSAKAFIESNLLTLAKFKPLENQILLTGSEVSEIAGTVGGKNLKTGQDIVNLFKACFHIRVDNVDIALQPEDLSALRDQFTGFETFLSFDDYVRDTVLDGLSLHLWGSTRGTVAYR